MRTQVLGSQFMAKLESTGYSGVHKWYKNVRAIEIMH